MKNSSSTDSFPGKNSQELHLKKIIRKSVIATITGGILLILLIAINAFVLLMEEDRLETLRLKMCPAYKICRDKDGAETAGMSNNNWPNMRPIS